MERGSMDSESENKSRKSKKKSVQEDGSPDTGGAQPQPQPKRGSKKNSTAAKKESIPEVKVSRKKTKAERHKESKRLWTALKKHVFDRAKSKPKVAPTKQYFNKWAPTDKDDASSNKSESSGASSRRKTLTSLQDEPGTGTSQVFEIDQRTELDASEMIESLGEITEEEEMKETPRGKSRSVILRDLWKRISAEVRLNFDNPTRVYKLRGYHSEPDLSLPFEVKFPMKNQHHHHGHHRLLDGGKDKKHGELPPLIPLGGVVEKFVSMEDILHLSMKEYPELIIGRAHHETPMKFYGIGEALKCTWLELADLEKKRFSFFDELFAMGYVVDSLEVPAPPPRHSRLDKSVDTDEYFVVAEEKHFRKKVDYGRVVFKTKHVYTGNFQDWYFEGTGKYCWEDGTVYQGEFSQGVMHGPGSIHWPDGTIYEGHFINGLRTGWGVYSSAEGQTYAGEWVDGLPHGHGKMWYDAEDDENDYYEGQLERGLPQGSGTRQYATGDRYIGNWSNGLRNGYGIMIWLKERQVYKGEWLDGVPHGFGKHIWYLERAPNTNFATRHVYTGAWVMGRREGIGKMIYPCGSIYEGSWKNGQRHGKGMFINPAGDILVGLFRAGAIVGGSDVPLHAPTYECDFGGLADWMTAKFSLVMSEGETEEVQLRAITEQYLPHIRKLYHRAGEYSQKYGNHGLYPAYLKHGHHENIEQMSDYKQTIHRTYNRDEEADHMRGKAEKPEPLDGVNPVTRFGLWLLLKDCDNLLDEVTMAFYDTIWSETPPLSFQTQHNPFEPVYLWQFLQALIVTSVAYYVQIPRMRRQESNAAPPDSPDLLEDEAISEATMNSGISFQEHQRKMLLRKLRSRMDKYASTYLTIMKPDSEGGTSSLKNKSNNKKKEAKKKAQVMATEGSGEGNGKKGNSGEKGDKDKRKTMANRKSTPKKAKSGGGADSNLSNTPGRSSSRADGSFRGSIKAPSAPASLGNRLEEYPPVSEDDPGYLDELMGEDYEPETTDVRRTLNAPPVIIEPHHNSHSHRKSVRITKHESDGEPLLARPVSAHSVPIIPSISECFETFIVTKLLPCLKRESGANLPLVPQPLPALVDMYDVFKSINNTDVIKGEDFLRSSLPHLIYPNTDDILWWHRSTEPLSVQVDIDEVFQTYKEKISEYDSGRTFEDLINPKVQEARSSSFNIEDESEYLGPQAQHSDTTMKLLHLSADQTKKSNTGDDDSSCESDKPKVVIDAGRNITTARKKMSIISGLKNSDSQETLTEFLDNGNAFGEEELTPEPFLWADDYKCIPIPKHLHHFQHINSIDVFNVFKELYPHLCDGTHERDLTFEFIFCDWLWCTSLLAKKSTDREFKNAWSPDVKDRPITNPQSLGVYAHHVKQIKNNPHLATTIRHVPHHVDVPKHHHSDHQIHHENHEDKEKGVVTFSK